MCQFLKPTQELGQKMRNDMGNIFEKRNLFYIYSKMSNSAKNGNTNSAEDRRFSVAAAVSPPFLRSFFLYIINATAMINLSGRVPALVLKSGTSALHTL